MKDFIEQLSLEEQVLLGMDLQVQLERGTGTRPVLWLLCRARERAATAISNLVRVSPLDSVAIIALQEHVNAYDLLMQDCQALLARGKEADKQIDDSVRTDVADALDIDEARELGLQQTPEDT